MCVIIIWQSQNQPNWAHLIHVTRCPQLCFSQWFTATALSHFHLLPLMHRREYTMFPGSWTQTFSGWSFKNLRWWQPGLTQALAQCGWYLKHWSHWKSFRNGSLDIIIYQPPTAVKTHCHIRVHRSPDGNTNLLLFTVFKVSWCQFKKVWCSDRGQDSISIGVVQHEASSYSLIFSIFFFLFFIWMIILLQAIFYICKGKLYWISC